MLFQFQTGIRIGELCVIRYEDLTEQRGYIHIQRMLRRDTSEVVSQLYAQNIAKSWKLFRRAPTKLVKRLYLICYQMESTSTL